MPLSDSPGLLLAYERNQTFDPDQWKGPWVKALVMTHEGKKPQEIAKATKLTLTQLNKLRASSTFLNKLAALNIRVTEKIVETKVASVGVDEARRVLNEASLHAALKVIAIAQNGTNDMRIQLQAAQDILDRSGLKPIEILETRQRTYTPEEVQKAQAVLLETEKIIKRLSNQASPYVISVQTEVFKKDVGPAASSETDQAHDAQTESSPA